MIKKLLLFLGLVTTPLLCNFNNSFLQCDAEEDVFIIRDLGNNLASIIGVNESYKNSSSLRIYKNINNYQIVNIEQNAFVGCNQLKEIMLTNGLTRIDDDYFSNNDVTIYYTGSIEQFELLNYSPLGDLYPYCFDEGFINLWNDNVLTSSVCDVDEATYLLLNGYYINLGVNDRMVVDSYEFDSVNHYTIKDGMEQLKTLYTINPKPNSKDISQNATLILVVVIAIIGMTSICVFYSFKENELIS